MPLTDSNNATWRMLRWKADFEPRAAAPGSLAGPELSEGLYYDDARNVLELVPLPSPSGVPLLPGVVEDALAERYFVDPDTRRVLQRRCDAGAVPVGRDPCIVRNPGGMALDRRGLLYICDRDARRVVVLDPLSGAIHARLGAGLLHDPIDVVIDLSGRIFVADRRAPEGGLVHVFTSGFTRICSWPTRNAEGFPTKPRPVAITLDDSGAMLIADASHPRLLRFQPDGRPEADIPLPRPTSPNAGAPRFVRAGDCDQRCGSSLPDLAAANLELHRFHRLERLTLSHTFAPGGTFISAILDAGKPGVTWHKLEIGAAVPRGSRLSFETSTSDTPDPAWFTEWASITDAQGRPASLDPSIPDRLIHSTPGRYLRVRVTFASEGAATPELRFIRVLFPRVSYLESLPRVYRADPDADRFLERYLALFERVLTSAEDRYEQFSRWLDFQAAPDDILRWLAALLDLSFDKDWPIDRRRALVGSAMELYRRRGTPWGIREYIRLYTGLECQIREDFMSRPSRVTVLGGAGFVLGAASPLTSAVPDLGPDEAMFRQFAHRFEVLLYIPGECDDRSESIVDRIIEVNKPAHTVHRLSVIRPGAQLGRRARAGVDLVLGARRPPRTQLAPHQQPADATLGVGTVLSDQRPHYPKPHVLEI